MWDLVVVKVAVCYSVNPLHVSFTCNIKVLDKGMSVPVLVS